MAVFIGSSYLLVMFYSSATQYRLGYMVRRWVDRNQARREWPMRSQGMEFFVYISGDFADRHPECWKILCRPRHSSAIHWEACDASRSPSLALEPLQPFRPCIRLVADSLRTQRDWRSYAQPKEDCRKLLYTLSINTTG